MSRFSLNDADRIARENVARRRAQAQADERRSKQESAHARAEIEREIRALVPEVLGLIEQHGRPPVESIAVLHRRFPPLGDLFGDFRTIRGGWSLGSYGHQSLHLLASGELCWERRIVRRWSDVEHCATTIRAGLRELRDHVRSGTTEAWRPSGVRIR